METGLEYKVKCAVMKLSRIHFKVLSKLNICHFVLHRVRFLKGKAQNFYRIRGRVEDKKGERKDTVNEDSGRLCQNQWGFIMRP